MRAALLTSLGLLVAGPSSAQMEPDRFELQLVVTLDATTRFTPRLIVLERQEGAIEVISDHGDGLELRALARRVDHPSKRPGQWVSVSMQVSELSTKGKVLRATPTMLVPLHGPAAVDSTSADVSTMSIKDDAGRSKLELTLRASKADRTTKLGGS
jgi:hypothetical protein